jgi:hypothetical protein
MDFLSPFGLLLGGNNPSNLCLNSLKAMLSGKPVENNN